MNGIERESRVENVAESYGGNTTGAFNPTFNISVTVSGSADAQEVGEKIAFSARESFEREWEKFMHEKLRRSFE